MSLPTSATLTARLTPFIERLKRYFWLWPPTAFVIGLLGFFLVNRQQWLGAVLALGLLFAWCLLLAESLLTRLLARRGQTGLPRMVTTFIAQLIHQETLFFTLPFFLATTVWASGQAVFTLLLIGCGLLAILDPLYFGLAQRHRWLYFMFHALCVFVVVLVTLPIMLHLTTGQSLLLAIVAMAIFSVPSLINLMQPQGLWRWLAMFGLIVVLSATAWMGRVWIPPATLWLSGSALSPSFDVEAREPRGESVLTPSTLSGQGLYAYTAIRAPRGLREKIYHVWRHDGEVVDRIPLIIRGGREQGYRAWTHKQNFPSASQGRWQIDVMTATGQRIGTLRFRVDEDASKATQADGDIHSPPGLPGWNIRHLVAGANRDDE
ncbi:DUF5924 family protein [Chromohalobacter israelensis]|uniref:DUF5924 family protein n=1 Tax=Chromohalobacter israelensis TaxID=141390 RepID=UPI000552A8FE|nr:MULTISPECIES: DUF5924 family protein [Chromohalobacter]MDF9435848.1 DUF5924 family protein [Chromohalobacter israelensis]PWW31687.1 hypothetical protein DFO74_13712 [Chromohalobacter salexigens]RXE48822.1 hypothetical protein B4O83_12935 [Chromohalobacter salexigens]